MDCRHVREHLSDYIDGGLDAKNKALVEEHLSVCKDCRQEVASLRMLIRDLGSMETVAPPKDFLEQFHRRMERRSGFSKILNTLSIPIRAKLPMKLAGAVVMAVLVFAIFQIQEDQYGTKITPMVRVPNQPESSFPEIAKTPLVTDVQEETSNTGVVRKKAEQQPQAMRVAARGDEAKHLPDIDVKKVASEGIKTDPPSREGGPIERSSMKMVPSAQEPILSKTSSPKIAKAPLETGMKEAEDVGAVWERIKTEPQNSVQTIVQKDEAISLSDNPVKRITHMNETAGHSSWKGGLIELSLVIERERQLDITRAALDMEASQVQETKMRERLMERELSIEDLLPRLREVIERAGGEVVSVEYKEGTKIPQSVYAEIPAEQIGVFQNDLQTLGILHGAPIAPSGEDNDILPIRIRFLTP